jgi:predicted dehydrogenase
MYEIKQMIRIAVIGVGSLGQHHARILSQHKNALLKFVVDKKEIRAKKIAQDNNTKYLLDYTLLLNKIDAVIISVPTIFHYEITKTMLQHGIHCLVEKPFTSKIEEADELIQIAKEKNLILQVGHVERFNPSIVAAIPLINNPKFIEVNRLGPYINNDNNIGVVLDLMIHDLDILSYIVKESVSSFEAYGARLFSTTEDIAKVRLRYQNNCIADVSASRISITKYRTIRIFQPKNYISIDYIGQTLKVYTVNNNNNCLNTITPTITINEPLFYELDDFLTNILYKRQPSIAGEQGKYALELALNILNNMVFL